MDIPEYSEEDAAVLKKGFQRLRRSNPEAKVPFFWIETAGDGHPRLFVGLKGKAKVPGAISNPAKRTAKDKKNISEGIAWKNESQGITFQVLKGAFRINKAKKLVKLMEKALKVKLGKIEIHVMDADEAARVGQGYVAEIEAENQSFTEEADKKHLQADSLKKMMLTLTEGSIAEKLEALPPGTITEEEKQALLQQSPSERSEGLRRLVAQKELDELEARAQLIVLTPKEHNKFVTGAFAKAEASSMKWRSRLSLIRDPKQDPIPWSATDEWELDVQVHREFTLALSSPDVNCSSDDILFQSHQKSADEAKTQLLDIVSTINAQSDDVSEDDVNTFNTELSNRYKAVSAHFQSLSFIQDRLSQRTNSRLQLHDTHIAFYQGRVNQPEKQLLTSSPNDVPLTMWKQHPVYGKKANDRFSDARTAKKETKRYLPMLSGYSTYISDLLAAVEEQHTIGKDRIARFNLLPAQREEFDALITTRDENNEAQKSQRAAQKAQKINRKIREKTRDRQRLQEELQKLKSSFFKRKKTKARIKELEALIPNLDKELQDAQTELNEAQSQVDDVLSDVIEISNEEAILKQQIRDLKAKKKKSLTGKSSIQKEIDELNVKLETVSADLDKANESSRANLVAPQARLNAATEAFKKKGDKRAALDRELTDLNKKLSKMVVFGRDALKAKRLELQSKISALDTEISDLREEQNKWAKEEMEYQSVEESISILKLDATTQKANAVETELTEAIEEAGLGEQEREYQGQYAQTKEAEETLQQAQHAKAQTQLSIRQLEMEKSKVLDDQLRTSTERLEAVAKQRDATAALTKKDQYLNDFQDPVNQEALKKSLSLLNGSKLESMFPSPPEGETALQDLKESILLELVSEGITTASESFNEDQVAAILQAKEKYLKKERDILANAAEEAQKAADLATAKSKYIGLRDKRKTLVETRESSEAELKRLTGELSGLEEEYNKAKAEREKNKEAVKKLTSKLELDKQAALEAQKVVKHAKAALDAAEGESDIQEQRDIFNAARDDYSSKKEAYKKTNAKIERYSLISQHGANLKKSIKIKKAACEHITNKIGTKKEGLIHDINQTIDDMAALQKAHPNAFDDENFQKEREAAAALIQEQIDAAQDILNENSTALTEAQTAYADSQKTLNELESSMMDSVQDLDNAEEIQEQIQDLHRCSQDLEAAELERQLVESRGIAIENREEINDIYSNALAIPEEAQRALDMFKNVEDIYEGSKATGRAPHLGLFGDKTGPSQLQTMAKENPEEYAVAMEYIDKIVEDVMRLKALGQPQEKYMHLLSPIPRAFWPDTLITESKDFAEIEELFANEEEDDAACRTNIIKKAMASDVGSGLNTAIDYGNNLNGFILCASDVHGLLNKSLDTVTAAWPVASTIGVVLSAANMVQEVNNLLLERQERGELDNEELDVNELTDEKIREIREKLEKTGMDDLLSLGEGMTDLLYKSSFAAECFMSVGGGSVGSVVPGLGVASTSILLALKSKQAVEAYSKHADDMNLLTDVETEEENADDFALQNAMKNRAERSRQQAVLATADTIGAAGALTAQAGLVVSAATGPGAAVGGSIAAIGWMTEAVGGAVSAGLKAFYNISAARKAKATLKKAQKGSRRAMMDIFQNSATYSTQLMLKRATEGNKAAIRFCESKGITKGMLVSDKMSKGILRKMLLDDADQTQEVEGGQNIREMWDSLNSAKNILAQSNTGASANDPGPTWFKVQNRLINAQINATNRLMDPDGNLLPEKSFQLQIRNLEKMLQKYPAIKKSWTALKSELEDEQQWKPATFTKEKQTRLANINTALTRIDVLESKIQDFIDLMTEEDVGPFEWEAVLFAA